MSTRRQRTLGTFAATAAAVLLASGVVVWQTSSSDPENTISWQTRSFHSRPDLQPPAVNVTTRADALGSENVFVTLGGPLIVDDRGEPVWYLPLDGTGAADLDVQQYQGQPVLTWWEGTNMPTFGEGEWVIANSSYQEVARIRASGGQPADLHDLLITPQDTALLMTYEETDGDLRAVGGAANGPLQDCVVQEIDIATGEVLFEWRASDHVGAEASHALYDAEAPYDFFHLNSIDIDDDGNLLLSSRHTSAIYKVDRTTGDVLWTLGGVNSDFAIDADAEFGWQHDAQRQTDGTISLFDNSEGLPTDGAESSGLILRLDETNMTAKLARRFTHPDAPLAISQGSMEVLDDGSVFVGWGSLPRVSQFTSEGALVFDATFPNDVQSYRAYRLTWHGQPSEPPAVSTTVDGDELSVYVSWNGATEVERWEVLAGSSAEALHPVASTARSGFETQITIPSGPPFLAVRAVGAEGRELGRSTTVQN